MKKFLLALVALVGLSGAYAIAANYAMTQGSGTTFGSVVVGGVNYAQQLICDLTTPSQCASVSAGGAVKVDGSAVTQPVSGTFWQTTQPVSGTVTPGLATTGGMTTFFVQPAASDNHTNIKNGAGQVYWIAAFNNSATVNYLRFYNAATGFNGCNSATNLVSQIQIPASTSVGGYNVAFPFGIPFATGISICVTSGYATTDTTNATATAMSVTIGYN